MALAHGWDVVENGVWVAVLVVLGLVVVAAFRLRSTRSPAAALPAASPRRHRAPPLDPDVQRLFKDLENNGPAVLYKYLADEGLMVKVSRLSGHQLDAPDGKGDLRRRAQRVPLTRNQVGLERRSDQERQEAWDAMQRWGGGHAQEDQEAWAAMQFEMAGGGLELQGARTVLPGQMAGHGDEDREAWAAMQSEVAGRRRDDMEAWAAMQHEIAGRTREDVEALAAMQREIDGRAQADKEAWAAMQREMAGCGQEDMEAWEAMQREMADDERLQ